MAATADESSMPNKGIKIGLIVALLGAAGVIAYTQRSTKVEQPDTPDTATTYVCGECGHGVDLTAAEYAKMVTEGNKERQRRGEPRGPSSLKCPQCQNYAMAIGVRCPKDGTPIPPRSKDGKPGRCKKCGHAL
jgi:hypothetical protein